MRTLWDFGKKLLFPPLFVVLPVIVLGATLLIYVFVAGLGETPVAYAAYALSFYALVLACACLPQLIHLSKCARQNEHVDRFLSDYTFRTHTTLGLGLLLNLAFAVFKLFTGVIYGSYWLIALGVYYAILAMMRFFLLRRLGGLKPCASDLITQYRTYRVTGVMMFVLNVVMTAIIFQVVRDNQTYSYPGVIIYAFGAYAFYKIIMAAVNLIRRRREEAPLFAAVRFLSFAVAMMSIFSLQTALLSVFGAEEPDFCLLANTASGTVICAGIMLIAVTMIVRSTRAIRSLKINNS